MLDNCSLKRNFYHGMTNIKFSCLNVVLQLCLTVIHLYWRKSMSFKNLSSTNSYCKHFPQAVIKIRFEIVFSYILKCHANQTYYIVLFVVSIIRNLKMFEF